MVRGGYVEQPGGSRVWQEWRPNPCLAGHDEWQPATWACPECRWPTRAWECRVCGEVVWDPDHQHGE